MKIRRRLKVAPTIPFIAFADIAWQLVIFFLVASSFAKSDALKVDLPSSSSQTKPAAQPAEPVIVQAGAGMLQISVGSEAPQRLDPRDLNAFRDVIVRRLKGKKTEQERAVVLQGRADLSFQQDVDLMFTIQQAGGVLVMMEEEK